MEAGEPRLLRLLNPAGEVKLCSDVDPRLLESGDWSSRSSSSRSSSSPSEVVALRPFLCLCMLNWPMGNVLLAFSELAEPAEADIVAELDGRAWPPEPEWP